MIIHIDLNEESVDKAIKQLNAYKRLLDKKTEEIAKRLAEMGATKVSLGFARSVYNGPQNVNVTVENRGNGQYAIVASGETVLFAEFGAGVRYGYGHPEANAFGMGPGTYPNGKGHWNDPKGWWIPKSAGGGHTFGNPPNMPMYNTEQELKKEIDRVVREVLSSD
jgi:hypothetical protein